MNRPVKSFRAHAFPFLKFSWVKALFMLVEKCVNFVWMVLVLNLFLHRMQLNSSLFYSSHRYKMSPFKIIIVFTLLLSCKYYPQGSDSSVVKPVKTRTNTDSSLKSEEQFSDVFKKIFKIKTKKETDSLEIEVGKLYFAFLPGVGYTQQSGFTGIVTANVSFYNGSHKTTNISVFNTDIEYSPVYHQTFLPFVFNVWLKNNKLNILGDLRYLKFPHSEFGVGGEELSMTLKDRVSYEYLKMYLNVFKPVGKNLYMGLGYNIDYHWHISDMDVNTNFEKYNGNLLSTTSSGPTASFKFDSRQNANNPQGGEFFSVTFRDNLEFLKSTSNWQSLIIDCRKYFKLRTVRSNIIAFWSYNWLTFGNNVPYFDLPSTGWDTYANLGRGYIQGRFRTQKMIYLESEYRFGITRNGLLGGVIFANAQYVSDWPDTEFNHIFPATGAGLRVKINKVSRVNFAVDYSIGINGSRGFFFNIGEVF